MITRPTNLHRLNSKQGILAVLLKKELRVFHKNFRQLPDFRITSGDLGRRIRIGHGGVEVGEKNKILRSYDFCLSDGFVSPLLK
jgi:hypothetical protein